MEGEFMQVNMHEAKTMLSKLVEKAVAGEEVVIAKAGEPQVTLTPVVKTKPKRQPGSAKGKFWMSDDFNERDREIEELFYGKGVDPE